MRSCTCRPSLENAKLDKLFFQDISFTFGFGSVGGDCVEDVDEDEEERYEERHPAGDDVRGNHETDPRHNDKQTCSKLY